MPESYFPCGLNIANKRCLVLGNDKEAREKALCLLKAGAGVTVIASEWPPAFQADLSSAQFQKKSLHEINADDMAGFFFALLCVKDDPALTQHIAKLCQHQHVLLCAIDQPDYCDVVNVSVFDKGRLRMAISTGGAAPALSRKIRQGLEQSLKDVPIDAFLDELARLRKKWEKEIPDGAERRKRLIAAVEGVQFKADVQLPEDWEKKFRSMH